MNELSQLDQLAESDVLDALGQEQTDDNIEQNELSTTTNAKEMTSNDLASLLSQLLNNKTIEITIKIKD